MHRVVNQAVEARVHREAPGEEGVGPCIGGGGSGELGIDERKRARDVAGAQRVADAPDREIGRREGSEEVRGVVEAPAFGGGDGGEGGGLGRRERGAADEFG
ncbi:hypothetical protein [Sphingomonas sp.]|uniref:hypothetical protein n=1 Tax=Sphingomonas sp. TaxID=28214 RepID=UPI0034261E99